MTHRWIVKAFAFSPDEFDLLIFVQLLPRGLKMAHQF